MSLGRRSHKKETEGCLLGHLSHGPVAQQSTSPSVLVFLITWTLSSLRRLSKVTLRVRSRPQAEEDYSPVQEHRSCWMCAARLPELGRSVLRLTSRPLLLATPGDIPEDEQCPTNSNWEDRPRTLPAATLLWVSRRATEKGPCAFQTEEPRPSS